MRTVLAWILAVPPVGWALVRFFAPEDSSRSIALQGFTPYATGGALVALLLILMLRRRLPLLVAGVAVLALVVVVAPRAIGNREEAGGDRLTVLTNNTRFGGVSPGALAALAGRSGADVVSLQELTPELAEALASSAFGRRYPFRVLRPDLGAGGTGLYSRMPLRALAPPDAPGHLMTAARLTVTGGGPTVDLVSVHPVAPTDPGERAKWRRALAALPAASPDGRLRILAGDFNATLDHGPLRTVLATGYADAAERGGKGLIPTWPERQRLLPPLLTLDHVLIDERMRLRDVSVETLPGTDHRAVVARLAL